MIVIFKRDFFSGDRLFKAGRAVEVSLTKEQLPKDAQIVSEMPAVVKPQVEPKALSELVKPVKDQVKTRKDAVIDDSLDLE